MNRTERYLSLAIALAVVGMGGCAAEEEEALAPPNVVVIVTDDLGFGDVGYNGSEIRTPQIDVLAREGVTFDRFYVHPICSPTRAALMTGRSPLNTGVLRAFEPWFDTGLPLDEKILAEYFQDAGYQTFAVGKWHLGPNKKPYYPQNRGFDHFYGGLAGFMNYYQHTVWGAVDWQRNGSTVMEEGYATHLQTQEAVRLIDESDPDRPMFLYLSYNAPHSPLQAPQEAIDAYSAIEDEHRRIFAAMVTEVDSGIGELRAALGEAGRSENTLIFFMSDNGGLESVGADNGPLRGEKFTGWEGGIRVPALIHWPAELPGESSIAEATSVEDVLPTLLAATGISAEPPKSLDGRNLWPALRGEAELSDRPFIQIWSGPPQQDYYFGYLDGEWKLVQMPNPETQEFERQLFNIVQDPTESTDLAAEHPEIMERLVSAFEAVPKAETHGRHAAPGPVRGAPGSPTHPLPDETPPTKTPYAEAEWTSTP